MAHKQTEEAITDYFGELLGAAEETKKVDNKPVASDILTNENNESHILEAVDKAVDKAVEVPTIAQPLLDTSDLEGNVSSAAIVNKVAVDEYPKDHNDKNAPTLNEEVLNIPPLSNGIDDTSTALSPDSMFSPEASSSATQTTSYEQHKQRLEKMLLQVAPQLEIATSSLAQEDVGEIKETQSSYTPLPSLSSDWLENGRPNWAQEQFDILLIEVNGLQLAVPLVALGQIQTIDEKMTPLFGQSDWFMGLQKSPAGNIKTVNTAKFVMPERYKNEHQYKYVVSINGLNWGLAVDGIHQPISIDPDSIRWRVNRSSRPWMAGMVKDHMCVLLDIPYIGELLQQEDKNHTQTTGG